MIRTMTNADYNRNVGRTMRIARNAARLTTRQIGAMVGLDQANVVRLESGKTEWTVEKIHRFSAALCIDVADVMASANHPPPTVSSESSAA